MTARTPNSTNSDPKSDRRLKWLREARRLLMAVASVVASVSGLVALLWRSH